MGMLDEAKDKMNEGKDELMARYNELKGKADKNQLNDHEKSEFDNLRDRLGM